MPSSSSSSSSDVMLAPLGRREGRLLTGHISKSCCGRSFFHLLAPSFATRSSRRRRREQQLSLSLVPNSPDRSRHSFCHLSRRKMMLPSSPFPPPRVTFARMEARSFQVPLGIFALLFIFLSPHPASRSPLT